MILPMTGSWIVDVHAVRPFTIHGDEYFELAIQKTDEQRLLAVRFPRHAIDASPAVGMRLELTFLMGQVTAAKVLRANV